MLPERKQAKRNPVLLKVTVVVPISDGIGAALYAISTTESVGS